MSRLGFRSVLIPLLGIATDVDTKEAVLTAIIQ
jgi:hypothetical protein